jgi:hypothetical protein
LAKAGWNQYETVWLLCGGSYKLIKGQAKNQRALDVANKLMRAVAMKMLPCRGVDGCIHLSVRFNDEDYEWHNMTEVLFSPQDIIRWASSTKAFPAFPFNLADLPQEAKDLAVEAHHSSKLKLLVLAADRFWKNADRDDGTTHPDKKMVSKWLHEQGLSKRLADTGATFIAPEWAKKGRKSEKW